MPYLWNASPKVCSFSTWFGSDPKRTSGGGLLKSNFVIRLTKFVSGRACFNAPETEFPATKSLVWVSGVVLHAKHYPRKAA